MENRREDRRGATRFRNRRMSGKRVEILFPRCCCMLAHVHARFRQRGASVSRCI